VQLFCLVALQSDVLTMFLLSVFTGGKQRNNYRMANKKLRLLSHVTSVANIEVKGHFT